MAEEKKYQLIKVAKDLGVGIASAAEELQKHGHAVDAKPTTKIGEDMYQLLLKVFKKDMEVKEEAKKLERAKRETVELKPKEDEEEPQHIAEVTPVAEKPKAPKEEKPVVAEIPAEEKKTTKKTKEKEDPAEEAETSAEQTTEEDPRKIQLKTLGKIDLSSFENKKTEKGTKGKKAKEEKPAEETPATEEEKKAKKTKKAKEVVAEEEKTPVAEEKPQPEEKPEVSAPAEPEVRKFQRVELSGPKVMGKMDLGELERIEKLDKKPESQLDAEKKRKKKKKKISSILSTDNPNLKEQVAKGKLDQGSRPGAKDVKKPTHFRRDIKPEVQKEEISDKEVQEKLKQTLSKLQPKGQGLGANRYKMRKQKRDVHARRVEKEMEEQERDSKVLKVTEFISANELAKMMDVPVTSVITTCFQLGMMVSINQRLDAETISILADEFGYEVQFVGADVQEAIEEDEDKPENLIPRPPIVTVMGHVDHGKTSLLDHIRSTNVIAGEAGGITQHIGAYEVTLKDGRKITFLDTPGHEAFTAMRARGAQLTDIAIIVVAADDAVMPQTREAISHAQAANVPMVFAINKMDKEGANADKIREQLAGMNILVEEWGGKFQCQEISAKKGLNIDVLLDKVLLEAELLDLKADPDRAAKGAIIEAKLDKGRGVVATIMVQTGTLRVGDPILAGHNFGKVKAMLNERGSRIESAGPSTPVSILGFSNAPQAGETFVVMRDEDKLKEIANKREQILREQGMRTRKHITLDEIGRRLAIGNFKELNIIVKADVDGSAEALTDSFLKLSTQEVQVNVILKSVGQISESDVNLAAASDAIIVGFQVRPSSQARKLAETDDIEIRYYSIIYDAIADVKAAMEGMLAPKIEEKIVGNIEVREVFKISKVGTIAGCYVTDGKFNRNTRIRVIRDGVVVHSGELDSLKRFKDDVKEVSYGYECGLSIKNFNDIQVGDNIEGYEEVEVKRKLQ